MLVSHFFPLFLINLCLHLLIYLVFLSKFKFSNLLSQLTYCFLFNYCSKYQKICLFLLYLIRCDAIFEYYILILILMVHNSLHLSFFKEMTNIYSNQIIINRFNTLLVIHFINIETKFFLLIRTIDPFWMKWILSVNLINNFL